MQRNNANHFLIRNPIVCHFGIAFFIILIIIPITISGRNLEFRHKNQVRLNLGGPGLFLSLEYERIMFYNQRLFICGSTGIGVIPVPGGDTEGIVVPHLVSANIGKRKNYFEAGLGGSYWKGNSFPTGIREKKHSYQILPLIGYRRQNSGVFSFRLFVSPLIHISGEYFLEDYKIVPFAGFSCGLVF